MLIHRASKMAQHCECEHWWSEVVQLISIGLRFHFKRRDLAEAICLSAMTAFASAAASSAATAMPALASRDDPSSFAVD